MMKAERQEWCWLSLLGRIGAVPTLIERDNQVPALSVLLAQAWQAEWQLSQVRP